MTRPRINQIPNQRKPLDPVSATALLWSFIVVNNHGINGGTNKDQIKLLMKQGYERRGEVDFSIEELRVLWTENSHGRVRTNREVINAIQSLRREKKVVVTVESQPVKGQQGKSFARYGLVSVLEKETAPPVEEKEIKRPNDVPGTDDFPGTPISGSNPKVQLSRNDVGLLVGTVNKFAQQLSDLETALSEQSEVLMTSLVGLGESADKQREAYNQLVSTIQELINSHAKTLNANGAELEKFASQTNSNFGELEEHYVLLRELFSSKFETHAVESKAIMDAYKNGYKEGFKDGRSDYRDDLISTPKSIQS